MESNFEILEKLGCVNFSSENELRNFLEKFGNEMKTIDFYVILHKIKAACNYRGFDYLVNILIRYYISLKKYNMDDIILMYTNIDRSLEKYEGLSLCELLYARKHLYYENGMFLIHSNNMNNFKNGDTDLTLTREIIECIFLCADDFIYFCERNFNGPKFKMVAEILKHNKDLIKKEDIHKLSFTGKINSIEMFEFLLNHFDYNKDELLYILFTCKGIFKKIVLKKMNFEDIKQILNYWRPVFIFRYLCENYPEYVDHMVKFPAELINDNLVELVVEYVDLIFKHKKNLTKEEKILCLFHIPKNRLEYFFKDKEIKFLDVPIKDFIHIFDGSNLSTNIFKKFSLHEQDGKTLKIILSNLNPEDQLDIISNNKVIKNDFDSLLSFIKIIKPFYPKNKKLSAVFDKKIYKIEHVLVNLMPFLKTKNEITKVLNEFKGIKYKLYILNKIKNNFPSDYPKNEENVLYSIFKEGVGKNLTLQSYYKSSNYVHNINLLSNNNIKIKIFGTSFSYNLKNDNLTKLNCYGVICNGYEKDYVIDEILEKHKSEKLENKSLLEYFDITISECCICAEETDRNVILLPCSHSDICLTCANKVKICPFCRSKINEIQL